MATGISIASLGSKFQDFTQLDPSGVVRFTVSEGVWFDVRLGKANELAAAGRIPEALGVEDVLDVQLGGYMLQLLVRPNANNSVQLFARYG